MKPITVTEYDLIIAEQHGSNHIFPTKIKPIPAKAFSALEAMILQGADSQGEVLDFMQLSVRKGIGKVITVKNYVGIIVTKDGTVLEILPKIADNQNQDDVRKLLLNMLKTLMDNAPFKYMQTAHLNTEKMPLLELFIRMFINEVSALVKRGLKGGYQIVQQNGCTFKGKLRVLDHIRANYAHKERCFVEYDSFELNRPENRIIKSTLLLLCRISSDIRIRSDLSKLLFVFDEVNPSNNVEADLQSVSTMRDMKEYETILNWCRVFLQKESFTPLSGDEIAFSLLFPMETLFESYIASLCRKYVSNDYTLRIQDHQYYLFDDPKKRFRIRPDIVFLGNNDYPTVVMDTKWKKLNPTPPNYGISQADMYQMYVYHKKYNAKKVVVIYPKSCDSFDAFEMKTNDHVHVSIRFIDLLTDKNHTADQEIMKQRVFNILKEELNGFERD